MKRLIVLSAPPGSGKSTLANAYKKHYLNTKIISSDEIRFELTSCYNDFSRQKEVWEIFNKRIVEYSKEEDVTVVLDALIDLNSLRKEYVELGKDYDTKILVIIRKPLEMILETNRTRRTEKIVPEQIVVDYYNKFEMPTDEVLALFDDYIYIDKYFAKDEVEKLLKLD